MAESGRGIVVVHLPGGITRRMHATDGDEVQWSVRGCLSREERPVIQAKLDSGELAMVDRSTGSVLDKTSPVGPSLYPKGVQHIVLRPLKRRDVARMGIGIPQEGGAIVALVDIAFPKTPRKRRARRGSSTPSP